MSGVCVFFHEWIKGSMEERNGSVDQWIKGGTIRQSLLYGFLCSSWRTIRVCVSDVDGDPLSGFGSDMQHVCRTVVCAGDLRMIVSQFFDKDVRCCITRLEKGM